MKWSRLINLILISILAGMASPPAMAQDSTVWVANAGGVSELEPSNSLVTQQLLGVTDGRAVAVDAARSVLWYAADNQLGHVTLGGIASGAFPVTLGTKDVVRLAIDPTDGTPWVAAAGRVRSFFPAGLQIQDLDLGSSVLGMAFGGTDERLWAATGDFIVGLNRSTGFEEIRLDPEAPIIALTVDQDRNALWVALEDELRRYSTQLPKVEEPFVQLPILGLKEIVPDGEGGLWAVQNGGLIHFDSEGEILLSVWPFASPRSAQRLAADPATAGVWATDGLTLVRLSAAGHQQELYTFGAGVEVRDLSPVPSSPETAPPTLTFVAPAAGAILEEDQPEILLSWSDEGSGINPKSLQLTLDGQPLEVNCSSSLTGASCQPEFSLDSGSHTLTASVKDFLANAAAPASVSFTVDLYSDDPVFDPGPGPGPGGGPAPYQPISVDRGLGANAVYVSDEAIEAISPANGNLTLSIPLGQTYSVGPLLSYSFQAVHNSSIWQRAELSCASPDVNCPAGGTETVTFSVPNPASNAGLGWELHFGRLFPVQPPTGLTGLDLELWPARNLAQSDPRARWMYVAPDGSTHSLGTLPGRPAASYSLDGSQLRLRQVNSNWVEIDMPNGVVAAFERTDSLDGTLFCAGAVSGCWRLAEQRDPYLNKMWMEYPGASSGVETWKVHDSVGRVHVLKFNRSSSFRVGGDGAGIDLRSNGDEMGDVRRLITQVDLQAFGGSRAKYNFVYTAPVEVSRGGYFEGGVVSADARRLKTRLLSKITVPGIQPWIFESSYLVDPPGTPLTGRGQAEVTRVPLPSRGKLEYQYSNWSFPVRCDYRATGDPPILPPVTYQQLGVVRKARLRPNGQEEGRWIYQSFLGGGGSWDPSGPDCTLARWRRTEIRGPKVGGKYDKQVFYNAVAEGPRLPLATNSLTSWQVTDHGLPYTKEISVPDTTGVPVFLSQEVYHCPASGTCTNSHKKRSTYVRYASEFTGSCSKIGGNGPECWRASGSRVVERTVYHDDANRWMEKRFESQNGFGASRAVKTLSSFSVPFEEATSYDKGHSGLPINAYGYFQVGNPSSWTPAVAAPWILHPYSFKILKDGTGLATQKHRTDFEFNDKGTLTCQRRRRVHSGRKPQDLVTKYEPGLVVGVNAGLPTLEEHFGGDDGALGTDLCSTVGSPANGTKYTVEHAYQSLVRASTRVGGGPFPYTYRATIDPSTGLPSTTFDVADQPTTLTYDVLGRLTRATPAAALGEAQTVLIHHSPGGSNPWVEIQRKQGSTIVASTILEFDHLGRKHETRARRPRPTGGWAWSKQQTLYDAAGRLSIETTLQDQGSHTTLNRTRYSDFNAFGQATKISAPDRQTIRVFYFGDRKVERRAAVATSETATEVVSTSVFYDASGRVVEESGPLFRTTYDPDPSGQVVRATRFAGGQSQVRTYGWDGRGLMAWENLPEIGPDSSGPRRITYSYDAMGHLKERWDGRVRLKTEYDLAGRPTKQFEGSRVWQEWVWGTTNSGNTLGSNLRRGKLEIARRHNYPTGNTQDDWRISEPYAYRGRLGQVSRRTTQLSLLGNPPGSQSWDTFDTQWTYDPLGNRLSLTYPRCTAPVCTDPGDSPGPVHTLNYAYTAGVLTGTSSSLGLSSGYAYHPNLELSEATYSSGVKTLWAAESHGMTRPQRIRVARAGGALLFDTGTYTYDPSGNIKRMGSQLHVYDKASRVLKGTVGGAQQQYTYDGFGNVTGSRQNNDQWQIYQVDGKNRYRTGLAFPAPVDIFYDVSGNMVKVGFRPSGRTLREWTYDSLGMVSNFEFHQDRPDGGTDTTAYPQVYGPGNYRFLTLDGSRGVREYTLRDLNGKVLRLWEVSGWGTYQSPSEPGQQMTFAKDYLYGAEGLFASRGAGNAKRFFHTDHLGSPRLISGDNGARPDAVLGRRSYFPYGADVSTGGQYDDRIAKFTGHERDVHGATDYMLGRSYAFSAQRFTSVDPGRDGWNQYAYADGNPIKFVDENGESPTLVTAGFGALIGGVAGAIGSATTQLIKNGGDFSDINFRDVGAAAAGGAVAGGLAGATLGLSLVAEAGVGGVIVVGATSNAIGGGVARELDSDPATNALDPQAVGADAVAGALGGVAGSGVEKAAKAPIAAVQRQIRASIPGAAKGNFGAAQSVRGHTVKAADLANRAQALGQGADAAVANVVVPAAVATQDRVMCGESRSTDCPD